jgi:hypothetical protein
MNIIYLYYCVFNWKNICNLPCFRSVIAVLAELSKKRKTINDDQSETGK